MVVGAWEGRVVEGAACGIYIYPPGLSPPQVWGKGGNFRWVNGPFLSRKNKKERKEQRQRGNSSPPATVRVPGGRRPRQRQGRPYHLPRGMGGRGRSLACRGKMNDRTILLDLRSIKHERGVRGSHPPPVRVNIYTAMLWNYSIME
eukprot:1179882-Prorocentrum_minimum.AAC.1